MRRTIGFALVVVVMIAGGLVADEIKGKVKSVDATKGTITVTVGDKETTYTVEKDAKILAGKGDKEVKGGLGGKAFTREGLPVMLKTEKKDGKEVVTEIRVLGGKKKKDNYPAGPEEGMRDEG
jgi:hypothetical protein